MPRPSRLSPTGRQSDDHPPSTICRKSVSPLEAVPDPQTEPPSGPSADGLPALLSAADIATMFNRSARTVRRWVKHGYLTPIRIGGACFFHPAAVHQLIHGER